MSLQKHGINESIKFYPEFYQFSFRKDKHFKWWKLHCNDNLLNFQFPQMFKLLSCIGLGSTSLDLVIMGLPGKKLTPKKNLFWFNQNKNYENLSHTNI